MSSLESVYFASAVAGATFFGEAVLSATFSLCSQPVHVLGAYVVLAFTALYLLYVAFVHYQVPTYWLTRLRHSCRRERTVTTIMMMVLTVVMFSISAIFFSVDIYLVSDGLLHPQKYPNTVVDLFGPKTTTQILLQGINVRHTWSLSSTRSKREFL
jgi:hypothetical protein